MFSTSWAAPCDGAGRNVLGFYRGWRLLPWLVCCVREFHPAHRPQEPAVAGDSDPGMPTGTA